MKRVVNYIPTVLVASLIMYLSLLREPHFYIDIPKIAHIDKLVHGLMYMGLSFIFALDLKRDNRSFITIVVCSVLLSSVYGGIIELMQEYYFPPRTGEWLDWAADIVGAVVGYLCAALIVQLRQKNSR